MKNKKQKNKKEESKKADNSSASFGFNKSTNKVDRNKIKSKVERDTQKNKEGCSLQNEIIENMPEGIYFVRLKDGIIVYTNAKFEKMFGYNSGEMIGKHASIVNAPTIKKPKETAREIMGIMEKTGEWVGEINNIKKDGTSFWCYASCFLFNHPQHGKIIVAMHSDITQRKIVEEKNKLDEEKFEEIFDYSPIAIELYNAKGELEKVNKATLQMFGIKDEKEVIGFKLFDDPNIPENTKKSLKKGELVRYENVFDFSKVRKFNLYNTAKKGFISLSTLITPIKKGSAGYLVMIEDISQGKETQIKLQEKLDEMEKINRLMVGRELKMIELKNKLEKLEKNNENGIKK